MRTPGLSFPSLLNIYRITTGKSSTPLNYHRVKEKQTEIQNCVSDKLQAFIACCFMSLYGDMGLEADTLKQCMLGIRNKRTNACANKWGRLNGCPTALSRCSTVPDLRGAKASGGGASVLRAKSVHRSMWGTGTLRALVTLRATSLPIVMYAAPITASATSATALS